MGWYNSNVPVLGFLTHHKCVVVYFYHFMWYLVYFVSLQTSYNHFDLAESESDFIESETNILHKTTEFVLNDKFAWLIVFFQFPAML